MAPLNVNPQPTGAQETKNVFSGTTVQTAPVHVGEAVHESFVPEESINVTVGVFYDGTLNNRLNVQSRAAYQNREDGLPHDSNAAARFILDDGQDTSYYNDESNVSRLEPFYPEKNEEKEKISKIYIEGIGTEDYEEDSLGGFAFGTGTTGVKGKVKIGCEKTVEKVKAYGEKKIHTLTIDTFGFSRGAAAARHFVHEITKKKGEIKEIIPPMGQYGTATVIEYSADRGLLGEGLEAAGIEVIRLVIRFVGIYDTVPSVGLPMNHKNNTRQLGLDAIKKANHVVHLTAADEHRSNFSLTNINSAGGKGVEVPLPGVHSDIGGGYNHNSNENVTLQTNRTDFEGLQEERQYLITQGWYLPGEIVANDNWFPGKNTLIGTRSGISNRYSYIPLQMMCKFGIDKGKVAFKDGPLMRSYHINSAFLNGVKGLLYNHAFNNGSPVDFNTQRVLTRTLRNRFFHFSAHFDGFLSPMSPRYVGDLRTRQIFAG